MKRPSPKRRLALNLRRSLTRVHRRFDVKDLGEGRVELTCRTCKTVTTERPGEGQHGAENTSPTLAAALARYWAHPDAHGVSGSCETCLQAERDRRYPLPKE